ncbi:cellulose synthase complex outer membrane protein BcsC [Zobellella iuensis]|uniref:Cellulose biosynthesis protein BcsC n=1 Tax=Zobellella iuensis TaxID=2803811 RepID=A0ABS1QVZ6_9GAMM|nr:cellulose synthase complex outer membrane protein BcsC [Zobellella iuensis]MBL1379043.1 cellulose biosynthesis protein BcsC [Zobellella iuensis]
MRTIALFPACLVLLNTLAVAQPVSPEQQREWLLERLRTGQAIYRDDIVRDALGRLELIAPDHPDVVLTRLSMLLQAGNRQEAEQLLHELRRRGADDRLLRRGEVLLTLHDRDGRLQLQQARLLAASGQTDKAVAQYQALFGDEPPDFALALEYWGLWSAVAGQRSAAVAELQALERRYPGNIELRKLLVRLLFAEARPDEALALLGKLAMDPGARDSAAETEFGYLHELPVGQESVQGWERFLRRYPDAPLASSASERLQQQQRLLADPAWQAGQRGRSLVEAGRHAQAEAPLRQALRRYPEEAGLHGALGQVLIQQGHYQAAASALAEAMRLEQNGYLISKWQELHNYSHSLIWLQRGEAALAAGQYEVARQAYRRARGLRPGDVEGLLGLAELALAEGDDRAAERWLQQAQRERPNHDRLLYALVDFYRERAPEQAMAVLDALPPARRLDFSALRHRVQLDWLERQIAAALAGDDRNAATALLQQAVAWAPSDPWLTYRLANLLVEQGRLNSADDQFVRLLAWSGGGPEVRYAHGLYLSAQERDPEALATLRAIPGAEWDQAMVDLAARLEGRQRRTRAQALRDAGDGEAAEALLLAQPGPEARLMLAGWAYQDRRYPDAMWHYREAQQLAPGSVEAALGQAETHLAQGQSDAARALLARLEWPADAGLNARRRHANLLAATGEGERAEQVFAQLLATEPDDPLLYRDAARFRASREPQQALAMYARGLAAAGLLAPAQANSRDDRALTRASRPQDQDGWLESSLRADVARLYLQQSPTVQLQHNLGWRTDNNPSGVSDLRLQTSMLRIEVPRGAGRWLMQAERVQLEPGRPEARDKFGSCNYSLAGCRFDGLDTTGAGLAVGWEGERWSWDIGHTPFGFELASGLGGVNYQGDWRDWGYRWTLSRRPMSNSLVSYAGAVDPVTGTAWGGVTANGVTLGLSRDKGEADGIWSSLGAHSLRGQNLDANYRLSAMGGYYYRLVDKADERLRAGASLMYWHYGKDLSEDTLGQGGYYSPQQYLSFGLPLGYARRGDDWSVALEGSLSWSYAKSDGGDALYLDDTAARILQAGASPDPQADQFNSASRSSGLGMRLQGRAERRLSDHWILGGGINWQHSRNYAPGQAFLYLRYSFTPWQGSLPLPVEPVTPYADWR